VGMDFHHPDQLTRIHMRLTEAGPLTADFVLGALQRGQVDFYDGERRMRDAGPLARGYARARIHAMDAAHASNRWLRGRGIKLPRLIRRALSRTLEGG
jgi:hypothetical protein